MAKASPGRVLSSPPASSPSAPLCSRSRSWKPSARGSKPRPRLPIPGRAERLEKALAADRERLRARLRALAERPEVAGGGVPGLPVAPREPGRLARPARQQEGAAGRAGPGALPLPHGGARHAVRPLLRLLAGPGRGRAGLAHPHRRRPPRRPTSGTPGSTWTTSSRSARTWRATRRCATSCSTAPTPASTAPPAACATPRRGSTARCAPTTWSRWIPTTIWRRRCAAPRGAPAPARSPRRWSPSIPTARSPSTRRGSSSPS